MCRCEGLKQDILYTDRRHISDWRRHSFYLLFLVVSLFALAWFVGNI